ncbi:hypothetical protein EV648_102582 [Kribbella sp. VKM Ac-2568]|nr:hypothetical protein EV648_102582 [Kribbella sp. VKM Ac-2568]
MKHQAEPQPKRHSARLAATSDIPRRGFTPQGGGRTLPVRCILTL